MRLDNAFESAIAGAEVAPTLAKFRKAAEGMEQVFLKQLFSQMRQVSLSGEEDSHGMEMYKDMMDDAMASLATLRGPVDDFFTAILVNAERRELRQNRLRLLFHLRAAMNMAADFSRIEG